MKLWAHAFRNLVQGAKEVKKMRSDDTDLTPEDNSSTPYMPSYDSITLHERMWDKSSSSCMAAFVIAMAFVLCLALSLAASIL